MKSFMPVYCYSFIYPDDMLYFLDQWPIVIVDIKPANMEELTEVITAAEFHPTECNLFVYSTSKGMLRLCDMRSQALCDKYSKCKSLNVVHHLINTNKCIDKWTKEIFQHVILQCLSLILLKSVYGLEKIWMVSGPSSTNISAYHCSICYLKLYFDEVNETCIKFIGSIAITPQKLQSYSYSMLMHAARKFCVLFLGKYWTIFLLV